MYLRTQQWRFKQWFVTAWPAADPLSANLGQSTSLSTSWSLAKTLCLIPLCLIIGAGCQVRSENRNNWWAAPPPTPLLPHLSSLPLSGYHLPGLETDEEGQSCRWYKCRVLMRAGIAESSTYLSLMLLSLCPLPHNRMASELGGKVRLEKREQRRVAAKLIIYLLDIKSALPPVLFLFIITLVHFGPAFLSFPEQKRWGLITA